MYLNKNGNKKQGTRKNVIRKFSRTMLVGGIAQCIGCQIDPVGINSIFWCNIQGFMITFGLSLVNLSCFWSCVNCYVHQAKLERCIEKRIIPFANKYLLSWKMDGVGYVIIFITVLMYVLIKTY